MAKTVTIPAGDNPFICKINDKYYSYPAGTTVSVPDEVAALIASIKGNDFEPVGLGDVAVPRDGSAGQVLYRTSDGAEWKALPAKELPAVSSTDNGKVLGVSEGAWAAVAASGSSGVMVVHDSETLDKTWQEIHDAMASGTIVIVSFVNEELHSAEIYLAVGCFTGGGDDPHVINCLFIDGGQVSVAVYHAATANDYPVFYVDSD